jgi:F0F1-type ATP synthase gamma subunit
MGHISATINSFRVQIPASCYIHKNIKRYKKMKSYIGDTPHLEIVECTDELCIIYDNFVLMNGYQPTIEQMVDMMDNHERLMSY